MSKDRVSPVPTEDEGEGAIALDGNLGWLCWAGLRSTDEARRDIAEAQIAETVAVGAGDFPGQFAFRALRVEAEDVLYQEGDGAATRPPYEIRTCLAVAAEPQSTEIHHGLVVLWMST